MNWLSPLMGVVAAVLQVYMLLLIVRILLTWVSMDQGHPAVRILRAVADPYLNWFSRFRFLTLGRMDFSPLAALLVLNFATSLAQMIGRYGQVTFGIVAAILLQLIWGAVSFFFGLLAILAAVRYLSILFRWGGAQAWVYLDAVVQPPAHWLFRLIRPQTFPSYPTALLLLGLANLAAWALGTVLVNLATYALGSLPF